MPTDLPPKHVARLDFLDVLRAIAALIVFAYHASGAFPNIARYTPDEVGQFGVMIFFLCSGFIIPVSLERRNSLVAFWITRLCRLYPLYWVSLAGALAIISSHLNNNRQLGNNAIAIVVANISMLQMFAGYENIIALYYTLAIEMLFYFLISVFFFTKVHKRIVPILAICLLCSILAENLSSISFASLPLWEVLIFLSTIFFGTLLYQWYAHEVATSTVLRMAGLVFATMIITGVFYPLYRSHGLNWLPQLRPIAAWVLAYCVFVAVMLMRDRRFPRELVYIGKISYSFYLLHILVLTLVPVIGSPIQATATWLAIVIGVSALTYRLVEVPGIALGRSLVQRLKL